MLSKRAKAFVESAKKCEFISSCYIGKKLFSINEILQYVPSTVCLVLIMGTFLVIPIIILYKGKMIQKQDFY